MKESGVTSAAYIVQFYALFAHVFIKFIGFLDLTLNRHVSASLLKEFNIEMKNAPLTPVEEEDENIAKDSSVSQARSNVGVDQVDPALPIVSEGEFRMSRISDRGAPPRTPSPMKAAYLQTGYSSTIKATADNHGFVEGNLRTMQQNTTSLLSDDNNGRNADAQEKAAADSSFTDNTFDETNVSVVYW